MKQIFAFESKDEYEKHQDIIQRFIIKLKTYQQVLEDSYALTEKPNAIVWTNEEIATTVFSDLPIPAYTNKNTIYMSPDLATWRKIFLEQLEGKELPIIQEFYENLSENQVFIILAHELTHHSALFLDEFEDEREDSIWFEEGMCFYLPRKTLLDEQDFNRITLVEMTLVENFKSTYGKHSIDQFGIHSYNGSLTSIMFDYWRSYLAVKYLVEVRFNHDIHAVFEEYHKWSKGGRDVPLSQYFGITALFD